MAREASITYEQVAAVCNKVAAEGGSPGSRNVREVLGSGSSATILKHIQQWKGGQERQSQAIDDTLDPSIVRAISNQLAERVQAATAEATARLAELQSETNNLIADAERQAALVEAQADMLATLQGEKATLAGRLAQVESDLARSVTDVANERQGAEAARTELAKVLVRLDAMPRIEAENDRLRAELEQARTDAAKQHEIAAVATATLEAERKHKQSVETQLAEATKRADSAVQSLGNERVAVQACQARLEAAKRELDTANDAAKEAKAESKKARDEAAELRGHLAATKVKPAGDEKKGAVK